MACVMKSSVRVAPAGAAPQWSGRHCVVARADRAGSGPTSPPETSTSGSVSNAPSITADWQNSGTSASVMRAFKSNRQLRMLRSDGKRASEQRLAAFLSALGLITLAWYGQDLITQLGRLTMLPVEDIDGVLYFIIAFNIVSMVLPKSRVL